MASINTHIIERNIVGCATNEEQDILHSWLVRSKANRDAYSRMKNIWDSCRIKNYSQEDIDREWALLAQRINTKTAPSRLVSRLRDPKPRRAVTISYRRAAVVLLFAVVGGAMLQRWIQTPAEKSSAVAYQEITVPYGARSKMLLPDGSGITLNAGTTLRYSNDFGKNDRDLWLDGEAYFVVNKSAIPFVVHAGTMKIQALGTQFNVKAYSSENSIETTLVEGKVAITDVSDTEHKKETILLPNQKLIVHREGHQEKTAAANPAENRADENKTIDPPALTADNKMDKQENIDPMPNISWKDNEWVIYRESLENLAVKLERRFDVTISFRDEHLRALRYNGTLPDESLEQVLKVITLVSPIQYMVKGKTVVFWEDKQLNVKK